MDPALEEILALLRCPEKLVRLRQASKSELECLNARIRAGEMKNKGGDTVSEALDEALNNSLNKGGGCWFDVGD